MRIILNENLQYGTIYYHSTSARNALNIVKTSYIASEYMDFKVPTISLTRDPRLHYHQIKSAGDYDVTFALDMEKLTNAGYAIKPFDYFYDKETDTYNNIDGYRRKESEEVLIAPHGVKNANVYIIGAYIEDELLSDYILDDSEDKRVLQFLKRVSGYTTMREYLDTFKRCKIAVYPSSDLNKLHSYRLKQLDKKRELPDYYYDPEYEEEDED